MDLNDLLNIGVNILKNKIGEDDSKIGDALSSILSDKDGNLDLSNIFSSLQDSSLGEIVSSWIGSGENAPIDPNSLENLLGSDKIQEFASKLNVDLDTAKEALSELLPEVVDKATPDGDSLLDQLGGLDGIMDIAKSLFNSK